MTPMTLDLAYFRDLITADLTRIDESLAQSESSAGTVMLDQSSVGRLSRMDALQQQAVAQEMRERLSLRKRKLEAALDRIDAGRFGSCCECSGEIEMGRLYADPGAVFCSGCAEGRERNERLP